MYYVIHSIDPYLLARFCTELQMEGRIVKAPFVEFDVGLWVCNYLSTKNTWIIRNFESCGEDTATRLILTESNYLEVLQTVLNNKPKVI